MKREIVFPLLLLLASGLACSLFSSVAPAGRPVPVSTDSALPEAVTFPTQAPASEPLYLQWPVVTSTNSESGQAPDYTVKTQLPVMQGDDARVRLFNAETQALALREAEQFKTMLAEFSDSPVEANNFFENTYAIVSPPGDVLSLTFSFYTYAGGAHPYSYTLTYTYDLQRGEQIRLEQLFLPGADYLTVIADYCKGELSQREIGFEDIFTIGAEPVPENYHNWNITPAGLLISFDPYQVAAYAAGPQEVTVPYVVLREIIDPQGALGQFR